MVVSYSCSLILLCRDSDEFPKWVHCQFLENWSAKCFLNGYCRRSKWYWSPSCWWRSVWMTFSLHHVHESLWYLAFPSDSWIYRSFYIFKALGHSSVCSVPFDYMSFFLRQFWLMDHNTWSWEGTKTSLGRMG